MQPAAIALVASLLAVVAAPLVAQDGPATFVVRRGADTIATETFTRSAARVEGELRARSGAVVGFAWPIRANGSVPSVALRVMPPTRGGGAASAVAVEVAFGGDSAEIRPAAAAPTRVAVPPGTLPFVNLSSAVLEQVVLRARAVGGDSITVSLLDPFGGATMEAVVRGASSPEATVAVAGVELRLALDPAGRVLGGWVPSQGVVFERTVPAGGRLPAGAAGTAASSTERPDYSPPAGAPYTAEEVRVPVSAGLTLGGTLTLPRERRGPVPVVVLASGTGPQDRDGAMPILPGYRFFRQVADTLGRRGIAVLRLDDRGVGASDAGPQGATTADLAGDLRAATAWLRTRPEIDGRRVAVAGHSEGALTAAMTAAEDPAVRAVVLLAGQARRGREISLEQNRRLLATQAGMTQAQRDSALAGVPAQLDSLAATNAWLRFWLDHDPTTTLRRVRQPVLVLHGATDWQVPAEDAETAGAALRGAGNRDVTVRVLPAINHLFLADPNPVASVDHYAQLPGKAVPPEVLGALADWLLEQLTR